MEVTMKTYILCPIMIDLLVCLPDQEQARTRYIHPDSTLSKIQTALNTYGNGDTVLVGPGIYYDNIICPRIPGGRIYAAQYQDFANGEPDHSII